MKANSVLPQRDGQSIPAAIKCVIIYEDFASGARAKHFAEMLCDGLGCACDCDSLWRSELMDFPEIGVGVAQETAASDYVIIALRGDRHLSRGFRRWIESWLTPSLDQRFSLIALFDSTRSASHAASARYSLRELSAAAGVPFFAYCPSGSDVPPTATSLDRTAPVELRNPRRSLNEQAAR